MSLVRPRIAVIDYDMGNRRSVEKALEHVGVKAAITRDPAALRDANALVLPGVGAFPAGMANLRRFGLDEVLRERAEAGTPLLGICLGMQLLFDSSTEHEHAGATPGLGLLAGHVQRIDAGGLRVPHIGWSEVCFERVSPLTADLPPRGAPFYHVHSFVAHPAAPTEVIGTADYGERFATIVRRDNVYGTQFHPEKSSRDGLLLLAAFAELARAAQSPSVHA